ncbi:MAG: hypothetical protein JWN48_5041, partial [Myxococcaceae bacterium]|nr:hypothetical protein [Myxococcaceae bacterium]
KRTALAQHGAQIRQAIVAQPTAAEFTRVRGPRFVAEAQPLTRPVVPMARAPGALRTCGYN